MNGNKDPVSLLCLYINTFQIISIALGVQNDDNIITAPDILGGQYLRQSGLAMPCFFHNNQVPAALGKLHENIPFIFIADAMQYWITSSTGRRTERVKGGISCCESCNAIKNRDILPSHLQPSYPMFHPARFYKA